MREPHLAQYLSHTDVTTVLGRLPPELTARVRDVGLRGNSYGVRMLGFVTRGRRDIELCSELPFRVTLREYLRDPRDARFFGAPERGQWPPWAVRRYLLYITLLHEVGHLQRAADGSFASERLANAFAAEWMGRLFSEPFRHRDPVHGPPGEDELATLDLWLRLDKVHRRNLVEIVLSCGGYLGAVPADAQQMRFVERLICA